MAVGELKKKRITKKCVEKDATSSTVQLSPAPAYFTEDPELQRYATADDQIDVGEFVEDPKARWLKREARRPRIDHLQNGTVVSDTGEVLPLFDVGDRILVERHTELLHGHPWLDTRIYVVQAIDDENGTVKCLDEEAGHRAYVGFKHPFTRIKLIKVGENPFSVASQKKAKQLVPDGQKKRRGRPKGSKNRSKEEIQADKKAKQEIRAAKASRRLQKRKQRK
jgi:hypothetical protein